MPEPRIVKEAAEYLVAYKPPKMHTAPLKPGGDSLLSWAAENYPEVLAPRGRKAVEGGLVHRLDCETSGLVLIARSQAALEFFREQQERGLFVKEYEAVCAEAAVVLPGFIPFFFSRSTRGEEGGHGEESVIESGFRAYGRGRTSVRPVSPCSPCEMYRTKVLSINSVEGRTIFRLQLTRGFRHQIRCHLAWLGLPIVNDALYGGVCDGGELGLSAVSLSFAEPEGTRINI